MMVIAHTHTHTHTHIHRYTHTSDREDRYTRNRERQKDSPSKREQAKEKQTDRRNGETDTELERLNANHTTKNHRPAVGVFVCISRATRLSVVSSIPSLFLTSHKCFPNDSVRTTISVPPFFARTTKVRASSVCPQTWNCCKACEYVWITCFCA